MYSTQRVPDRMRGCFRRDHCCHDFMKTDLRIANNNCFANPEGWQKVAGVEQSDTPGTRVEIPAP